jgi:uncharacterized membrane protein YqjE
VALAEAHATQDDSAGGHSATGEPSVSSAIEHLVASSQGVITKRIDLVLLEGQELLSHILQRAALVGFGMVLAAGAWFAAAACLVLLVTPNANLALRLAAFGLLNAGGALGFVALAMRGRPQTPARATGNVSSPTEDP